MNFFKPALILGFAFLAVFGEATLTGPPVSAKPSLKAMPVEAQCGERF